LFALNSLLTEAMRLHNAKRHEEAETLYRRVLEHDPGNADALHLLGVLAINVGRPDLALDYIPLAIARNDQVASFHANHGLALQALKRSEEAVAAFDKALALNAQSGEVWNNKGAVLEDLDRKDEAMTCYAQAARYKDDAAEPYNNLGTLFAERGEIDRAMGCFRRAMEIDPNFGEPQMNLGMCLMLRGRFEEGTRVYERRWHTRKLPLRPRPFEQPQWVGQDLRGRTLLIHAEQGMGDSFQFIRYAPLAAERGARVVVEMQPELVDLVRAMPSVADAVVVGDPLPAFDWHSPTMSLPLAFGTTLRSIPARVPYLAAPADAVARWAARLDQEGPGLRIGIAWAGRPTHKNDRNRSTTLAAFAPLAAPDRLFVALQKGPAAAQADNPPAGMRVLKLDPEISDFSDTAAIMANLDLVISVDTAIVHLAGALARPVWVMLPYPPEWRWLEGRQDSPWYPTMRLFRQGPERGGYGPIFTEIAAALERWAGRKAGERLTATAT
jgi:Tfp pilus assembly protein PilF